jgi:hypothetical protein
MEDSTGFAPKPPPPSLHEVCSFALLSNLASVLQAALVYADAGAAESIATTLGPHFLLGRVVSSWEHLPTYCSLSRGTVHASHAGLGAAHVCDLEHASPTDVELPLLCGASVSSLVFFTTRLLSDLHPLMLKAACLHPGITTITILSSISEHAHACQVGDWVQDARSSHSPHPIFVASRRRHLHVIGTCCILTFCSVLIAGFI